MPIRAELPPAGDGTVAQHALAQPEVEEGGGAAVVLGGQFLDDDEGDVGAEDGAVVAVFDGDFGGEGGA